MKKLFTLPMVILLTLSVFAQSPQKMSYQCVVRNNSGVLMTSQSVRIRISILQGTSSGTVVYTETQTTTTNANGLVSIEIGGGTGFDVINWANGPYFLKNETDPTGGTNYTISGTSQLLSVPYSLYSTTAKTADYNNLTNKPNFATVATTGSYSDLINIPTISVSTDATLSGNGTIASPLKIAQQSASTGQALKWNGTTWAPGNDLTGSASTPGGSSGYVQFNNTGNFGGDANFFWDNTNKRLGIGLNTPAVPLEINANSSLNHPHLLLTESEDEYARLMFRNSVNATKNWTIAGAVHSADANSLLNFFYWNGTEGKDILSINGSGNVGIGIYTPSAKLEVAGQIKITGGTPALGKVLTSDADGLATWEPPAGNSSHYIGESYGGGIVFYGYDNGKHGLIAATADQSTGVVWTNTAFQSKFINAVRDGINGGLANTERIIIQAGAGSYAAQLCADYEGGNYADWYLPSKYELYLLYLQKAVVGGFANFYYWSSTEGDDNVAWGQAFSDGNQYANNKYGTYHVRAIRAF